MLLAAAAVYVCCVYFTGDLINAVPALRPAQVDVTKIRFFGGQRSINILNFVEVTIDGMLVDTKKTQNRAAMVAKEWALCWVGTACVAFHILQVLPDSGGSSFFSVFD